MREMRYLAQLDIAKFRIHHSTQREEKEDRDEFLQSMFSKRSLDSDLRLMRFFKRNVRGN
jgi:hypothetical protein